MRKIVLISPRLAFSVWTPRDWPLAETLWGNPDVCRYIVAEGRFTTQQIRERLATEIHNEQTRGVQYWPLFALENDDFVGCCGLRPYADKAGAWELGFHLLPAYWGQGLAREAGQAVITYAFKTLGATQLVAGHHPDNAASARVLQQLGFCRTGTVLYPPTGRTHPIYRLLPNGEDSTH